MKIPYLQSFWNDFITIFPEGKQIFSIPASYFLQVDNFMIFVKYQTFTRESMCILKGSENLIAAKAGPRDDILRPIHGT